MFFFFQAEDGIRGVAVTGVQTCALPIYRRISSGRIRQSHCRALARGILAVEAGAGGNVHTRLRGDPEYFQHLRESGLLLGLRVRRGQRSEEHTSELQSRLHLVCRLLLETKNDFMSERGSCTMQRGSLR